MDKRLEHVCEKLGEYLSEETIAIIDKFLKENPKYSEKALEESFDLIKALSEDN